MSDEDWLASLLRPELRARATDTGVVDVLGEQAAAGEDTAGPFEGAYGRAYSSMIRRRPLRRAFFGLWGGAEVLYDLDEVVRAASRGLAGTDDPLLDVPCGQGVIAELLAQDQWAGRLIGLDLARRAVERATAAAAALPDVDARYVLGTALDLPFVDASVGAIVSVNGLHVMPDHALFLAELARVLRPGGDCWLVTPVAGRGRRASFMLRSGLRLGVLSQPPPTQASLEALAEGAGFTVADRLGGTSIVGLRLSLPG